MNGSSDASSGCEDDTENEIEQRSKQTSAKKRKKTPKREQPFMDSWLQLPQFKNLLVRRLANDWKAKSYCKLCEQMLTCSKTGIKRHASSKKHQSKEKLTSTTMSLGHMVNQIRNENDIATSMEVKICAFIVEHNLPLSISESMVRLLSSMFPNDASLKKVKLGKQKATNILRQVLGFDYLQDMVTLLQSKMFSIIIDKAIDKSAKKQLAIIAVFFDLEKFELQYWLVDLIETADGTANGIYSKIKETFQGMNIPVVNIVGYASDTTNVMFGQNHSVSQLLKSEISHVQIVKCSCQLIHLVSSQAALKLPKSVEDLCRDIYAHFHRSSKRQDTYKEFQAFF
ncbi:uncharacterized protein LOC114530155 [Dendronephthya gigantea]|uniref:uncharacterized protein LOC114530155 n=1 Tax=Dendronephthya gigantea TaxID=151771 RepID=UPI00106B0CC7|nr:uncharacterized protein LOC114530155 [Dendronephthya gigantea]